MTDREVATILPLRDTLDEDGPTMRVLAIDALETLHATEAVPRLMARMSDNRRVRFGAQITVAAAAKSAIERLR
jgi:HEAT repeat protein